MAPETSPAMNNAARAFRYANKVAVNRVAGNAQQWAGKAMLHADVIFNGAEKMFNNFANARLREHSSCATHSRFTCGPKPLWSAQETQK